MEIEKLRTRRLVAEGHEVCVPGKGVPTAMSESGCPCPRMLRTQRLRVLHVWVKPAAARRRHASLYGGMALSSVRLPWYSVLAV